MPTLTSSVSASRPVDPPSGVPARVRKIVFAIEKGGSGKTTTSVHVAVALARLGKRVLFLDLDAQGNATKYLGLQAKKDTLRAVLAGERPLLEAIERTSHGIDVLPGGANLDLTLLVERGPMAAFLLKQQLAPHESRWDLILMDCPPNLGTATSAALIAADEVLIPVDEGMALDGLTKLQESIEAAKAVNPGLHIIGFVQTKVAPKEALSQQISAALEEVFGKLVFPVSVPRTTKLGQSYLAYETLYEYDAKTKTSKAALNAFDLIARELLARGEGGNGVV